MTEVLELEATEITKSTHKCEVVPVKLELHENADSLSIVHIWGFQCVVRTEDWQGITRAAYCQPDTLVDVSRPEFSFLAADAKYDQDSNTGVGGTYARVKARKLRGVLSFGLLIPAPADAVIGEDWAERLSVAHWEPKPKSEGGNAKTGSNEEAAAPPTYFVNYDVDSLRRYHNVIADGEPSYVTEKLHGENSRYVWADGVLHCGSHTRWKRAYATKPNVDLIVERMIEKGSPQSAIDNIVARFDRWEPELNKWHRLAQENPSIAAFCEANPGYVLYGELYGSVQNLRYGAKPGEIKFAAFDILRPDGTWLSATEFINQCKTYAVPTVPVICLDFPYNYTRLCEIAEEDSKACPGQLMEGVVVKPMIERWDKRMGRVMGKVVSQRYYSM